MSAPYEPYSAEEERRRSGQGFEPSAYGSIGTFAPSKSSDNNPFVAILQMLGGARPMDLQSLSGMMGGGGYQQSAPPIANNQMQQGGINPAMLGSPGVQPNAQPYASQMPSPLQRLGFMSQFGQGATGNTPQNNPQGQGGFLSSRPFSGFASRGGLF